MLHDRHQLNGVVAGFLYTRKCVICKLTVGTDFTFLLRHTNVCFINIKGFLTFELFVCPLEHFAVIYNLTAPGNCLRILCHTTDIKRNMLCDIAPGFYNSLHLTAFPKLFFL